MPDIPITDPATDENWRRAIMDAADNPERLVSLMMAFYHDRDRADRTPRETMYLHIGMLSGAIMRGLYP
jgi:hypothetical protein